MHSILYVNLYRTPTNALRSEDSAFAIVALFPDSPDLIVKAFETSKSLIRCARSRNSVLESFFHHYEKLTNLGSLGSPSGPILFFANRPSVCILLASSKLTLRLFMIFIISLLLASSNPLLESPPETLPDRSNAEDDNPDSTSA